MKKIIYAFLIMIIATSCGEFEEVIYDNINGQNGLGFDVSGTISVTVPEEGVTVNVPVRVSTLSNMARSFSVSVDQGASTGSPQDYEVGSVTIPADSYFGELQITFTNFQNLEDFVPKTLVINLAAAESDTILGQESVTLSYIKDFICNDVDLELVFDNYPGETTWEISNQSNGEVVASGGPYDGQATASQSIFLEDGCYVFTIRDAFGDGICCAYGNGSYTLSCAVIELVSGGEFGSEESKEFCINQ